MQESPTATTSDLTATAACQCEGNNGYVFLPKGYALTDQMTVGRDSFWYIRRGKLTGKSLDADRPRRCRYCDAVLEVPK